MGPAIHEVLDVVHAQGIGPAGPLFDHHPAMHPDTFDFDVGFPVRTPVAPGVTAQRRGDEVEIALAVPSANTDGSRPANLTRVEIYAVTGTAQRIASRTRSLTIRGPTPR